MPTSGAFGSAVQTCVLPLSSSVAANSSSIMLNGLRQKPEPSVNSTNAPPWSFAECSNERPSSITTTRAPAPHSDAQSSCRVTDLPDPDLPNTATLWLPRSEEHTSELQSLMRIPYAVF